jgi:c-di-GMP-binding flagellar brake protein YcgR
MSESNDKIIEQRCTERIAVGEDVEFRCPGEENFRTATMVDFSEAGMLLLMEEEYTEGAQFEVRVKNEEALYFTVKCIRTIHCSDITDVNLYGYGCKTEDHRISPE